MQLLTYLLPVLGGVTSVNAAALKEVPVSAPQLSKTLEAVNSTRVMEQRDQINSTVAAFKTDHKPKSKSQIKAAYTKRYKAVLTEMKARKAAMKAGTTKTTPKTTIKTRENKQARAGSTSAVTPLDDPQYCQPDDILYGYRADPNTPLGFFNDATLASIVDNAVIPAGYLRNFTQAVGAVEASTYIGYKQLATYDTEACAALCDATEGCDFINIYIERAPAVHPGPQCRNPAAAAAIRCTMYSDRDITVKKATNIGQWRKDFMVVVRGSNGYKRVPHPNLEGFKPAERTNGLADWDDSQPLVVGYQNLDTGGFDPAKCVPGCKRITEQARADAYYYRQSSYAACNYINAIAFSISGEDKGTLCQYTSKSVMGRKAIQEEPGSPEYKPLFIPSYGYAVNTPDDGSVVTGFPELTKTTTFTIQVRHTARVAWKGQYLFAALKTINNKLQYVLEVTPFDYLATQFSFDADGNKLVIKDAPNANVQIEQYTANNLITLMTFSETPDASLTRPKFDISRWGDISATTIDGTLLRAGYNYYFQTCTGPTDDTDHIYMSPAGVRNCVPLYLTAIATKSVAAGTTDP